MKGKKSKSGQLYTALFGGNGNLPNSIGACGAVLADCRTDFALVDVLVAESAGEIWRTLTLVRVDAINASPAVLTQMTVAVVDVYLTTEM